MYPNPTLSETGAAGKACFIALLVFRCRFILAGVDRFSEITMSSWLKLYTSESRKWLQLGPIPLPPFAAHVSSLIATGTEWQSAKRCCEAFSVVEIRTIFYTFVHMKNAQGHFIKKIKSAYGGSLLKTRKGRQGRRPLATRATMHLVLRSTKARGEMSFKRTQHSKAIARIVGKFSSKYGVQILSLANVGNHLHFHIKLGNRHTYCRFIRAVTSAIAMAVSGVSRWNAGDGSKFWDYRPFTRIIDGGMTAFLRLRDYVRINQLEGEGFIREVARIIVVDERALRSG